MRKKSGFTLIELILTIVIVALIAIIAVPTVQSYLENSEVRSEEIFINELSKTLDTYVGLYPNEFSYKTLSGNYGEVCSPFDLEDCKPNIIEEAEISLVKVNEKNITDEIINPNGKVNCLYDEFGNENVVIIRRNQDYKKCYDYSKLSCLSEEYLENHKENTCFPLVENEG